MEKLFYIDNYLKEFVAEVTGIEKSGENFIITLDKTAFFPGGGGQPFDEGEIEGSKVIEVYEKEGEIYHVVDREVVKKHRVKCKIDWEKRFDYMQQHLAQHVISGCFYKLFNKNTAGIHLGKDIATIDIVGKVSEEELLEVLDLANESIFKNLKVEFLWPEKRELKKLGLRRDLPKTNEKIRIVKIDDLDINACCGVHPSNLIDLQGIKFLGHEGNKGNTRITYLAGMRFIRDSLKKDRFSKSICTYLSCSEKEVLKGIENLKEEVKLANKNTSNLIAELSEYKVKESLEKAIEIDDIKVLKEIYYDENIKTVSKFVEKVIENKNVVLLVGVVNKEKANLIFACNKEVKIDMGALLKDAITLIDGKGGGSKTLAQGGGKSDNVENALSYALNKIKR